jgi:uncharacterized membrane protein YebE (DUF533 family)
MPYGFRDYGVKGMKKGVRHEDPNEGTENNHGGGNSQQQSRHIEDPRDWKSRAKKVGKVLGGIGAGIAAGFLGRKLAAKLGGYSPTAAKVASGLGNAAKSHFSNKQKSNRSASNGSSGGNSHQWKPQPVESVHEFQKKLNDPNYVFDI